MSLTYQSFLISDSPKVHRIAKTRHINLKNFFYFVQNRQFNFQSSTEMKFFVNLAFFFSLSFVSSNIIMNAGPPDLCNAIVTLLHNQTSGFTVDIISNLENNSHYEECFKEIAEFSEVPFTVTRLLKVPVTSDRIRNFVIFAISNLAKLWQMLRKMKYKNLNRHGYWLIITAFETKSDDINLFTSELLRKSFFNVNFLVIKGQYIEMLTFYPFQERSCENTTLLTINEYSFNSQRWQYKTDKLFPPKLKNFHRCRINATVVEGLYEKDSKRKTSEIVKRTLKSSDMKILEIFANKHNIQLVPKFSRKLFITKEGKINKSSQIFAKFLLLFDNRAERYQFTTSYFSNSFHVVIPRGIPLTSFEKLLQPFEQQVWISLFLLLLATNLFVGLIKLQSRRVQHAFFERDINMSSVAMEVLLIILGGSHHILPLKNFSRLILTSFILYWLIIRTAYTSSLYQFLQVQFQHQK